MNTSTQDPSSTTVSLSLVESVPLTISPPVNLKRVCVFCGSSMGNSPVFMEAAKNLGEMLVEENIELVFGGGNLGIMGELAQTVSKHGGKVTGVIPSAMVPVCAIVPGEQRIVVNSMHARKRKMNELSDAFVALPGGFGTMDELFEAITWAQLSVHDKPIGVLNVNNFFGPLLDWIDNAIKHGFIPERNRELFFVETDPKRLLERLRSYKVEDGVRYKMVWPKTKSTEELI